MRHYADTPSQQARQFAANAALDAADASDRRDASLARIRAAHEARQKCRAERQALEERYAPKNNAPALFAGDLAEGDREAARKGARNFAAIRTGTDYERFVADLLTAANIPTIRVGGSGDYGADLLAEAPTGPAVIQCKFYTHPVGYDAVQQAYTAKALYKATSAYVVTNATYTPQARRAARRLGVTLTNHAEIVAHLYVAENAARL